MLLFRKSPYILLFHCNDFDKSTIDNCSNSFFVKIRTSCLNNNFLKQKFRHFLVVKEKTGICNKTFQYFYSFVAVG
jgi:hypothetical protein